MKKIKLGIIGLGNQGSLYTKHFFGNKCPEIELAAVADIDPTKLEPMRPIFPSASWKEDTAIRSN